MKYRIKRIKNKDEILTCNRFEIEHYLWNSILQPKAWGQMGYLPGEGFYVTLTCEESDPKRTSTGYMDKVYQDSAMEIFMAFPSKDEPLTNDSMYLNFEVNPNAAIYFRYGKGRKDRQTVPETYLASINCTPNIEKDHWSVSFLIPEALLCGECGIEPIDSETPVYFNFYKISESPEIEHYGCFSKIESETPNFHLPVCFAQAVIED